MAAVDAPRRHEPAVIVDRDHARAEEAIGHVDAVAAAMHTRAAAVCRAFVAFDAQREIAFEKFVGHVGKARPQRMAIGAVAHRPAGDPAKADLEQLEPFSARPGARVVARVEQVRARREAGGVEEFGRLLAQQPAQNVENAAQRMGAARQRGGEFGLE